MMGDTVDSWEDDEDDRLFLQLAAQTEANQLLELQSQSGPKDGIDAPGFSPTVACQAFQIRRDNLLQESSKNQIFFPTTSSAKCLDKVISKLKKQLEDEQLRSAQLQAQLLEALETSKQHEACIEELTQIHQELLAGQITSQEETKNQEEKNALKKEVTLLSSKFNQLENDLTSVIRSTFTRIGRSKSQTNLAPLHTPSGQTLKHKSLPNLQQNPRVQIESDTTNHSTEYTTVGCQANVDMFLEGERDQQLITGNLGEEKFKIGVLSDMMDYKTSKTRADIFAKMMERIELELQGFRPTLKLIESRAKKNIMARFSRGVEMKTCFPDFMENMFLYGVQSRRLKEMKENGLEVLNRYPKMPVNRDKLTGIINMNRFKVRINEAFTFLNAWEALKEVKTTLEQFLTALVGDERFQLYELVNLECLWRLLAWAKNFWRCVIFEEECSDVVSTCGLDNYTHALHSWTGLTLKTIWRDFYVEELDLWIRKMGLSLLEIVFTTGYFERHHKRYEILYSIFKDTLVKDYMRIDTHLMQKCLNIVTWSLADKKNIINYLCTGNNDGNCLAKLLGENILKCFNRQDKYEGTTLFTSYLHLVEALMLDRGPRFLSTVVKRGDDAKKLDDEQFTQEDSTSDMVELDVDAMTLTQFADPDKYRFEDGTMDRARNFDMVKVNRAWIHPKEWETTVDEPECQRCQCRKTLLGNVFIMMQKVVKWWIQNMDQQDKRIEKRWDVEGRQLLVFKELEEPTKEVDALITAYTTKMESIQQHISEVDISEEAGSNEMIQSWEPPEDIDPMLTCGEWLQKETIFDHAVKSGIVVMTFCKQHSKDLPRTLGSDAFNCFTSLASDLRSYGNKAVMTEAERGLLLELAQHDSEEEIHEGDIFSDTDFPASFKYSFVPSENVEILLSEDFEKEEENFDVFGDQEILQLTRDQHEEYLKHLCRDDGSNDAVEASGDVNTCDMENGTRPVL